jgi:hypothetical protein
MIKLAQTCRCNRDSVHCSACGSGDIYHKSSLDLRVPGVSYADGAKRKLPTLDRGFRCKHCGAEFRESSVCTAPLKQSKPAQRELEELRRAVDDTSEAGKQARRAALTVLRDVGQGAKAEKLEQEYQRRGLL